MEKEKKETPQLDGDVVTKLCKALASWYVRKDGKFFDIHNLKTPSSREDIERAAIHRFQEGFPEVTNLGLHLKPVFHTAITLRTGSRDQSIPVWNGSLRCDPSVDNPFIWDSGMVTINTWSCPDYRKRDFNDRDISLFDNFIDFVFIREPEKEKFLDWLAWNLQNERDKPTWAPFLYSETKGSGKSTLCELTSMLFGTQNNQEDTIMNGGSPSGGLRDGGLLFLLEEGQRLRCGAKRPLFKIWHLAVRADCRHSLSVRINVINLVDHKKADMPLRLSASNCAANLMQLTRCIHGL